MGPFVPSVIPEELNLVVALIIGVFFGYVLEQAGFSSAKRLVGLFYGYDFTVLRVFFTAAITACLGTLLFGYFGLLDLKVIFVNPLFLWPAVAGGAIMGAGFILGGYCPGTSVAAAAIGKVDAWFFVGGGVLGVLLYGAVYPAFKGFVDFTSFGSLKVFEPLGMSQGVFLAVLAAFALVAFVVTGLIERKVSPKNAPSLAFNKTAHQIAGGAFLALALIVAFLPDRQTALTAKVSSPAYVQAHPIYLMEPDELAIHLVQQNPRWKVYDLRSKEEFQKASLPRSLNLKPEDLFTNAYAEELAPSHIRKIVVADDQKTAETAVRLLEAMGFENLAALEGGFDSIGRTILFADSAALKAVQDPVVREFRTEAKTELIRLVKEEKAKGAPTAKKSVTVKGGC